jgi:hypothetical protein
MSTTLAHIAALVLRPGARDVAELGALTIGRLERMASELDKLVIEGGSLGLVTGAYMAWAAPPAAETDGPVGVAALASLLRDLGAAPIVITDEPCSTVVRACLDEVAQPEKALVSVPSDASRDAVTALAGQYDLQHVLAVERLGPSANGHVRTMRGIDITAHTAPLDALFSISGVRTSAIGDGGNEIGMGNLPVAALDRVIDNAQDIACRTTCDNLLIAGTSNWGCYALMAALRLMAAEAGRADSLSRELLEDLDGRILTAALSVGAIDGVTGASSLSVDGVPIASYTPLLRALDDLGPVKS